MTTLHEKLIEATTPTKPVYLCPCCGGTTRVELYTDDCDLIDDDYAKWALGIDPNEPLKHLFDLDVLTYRVAIVCNNSDCGLRMVYTHEEYNLKDAINKLIDKWNTRTNAGVSQ